MIVERKRKMIIFYNVSDDNLQGTLIEKSKKYTNYFDEKINSFTGIFLSMRFLIKFDNIFFEKSYKSLKRIILKSS